MNNFGWSCTLNSDTTANSGYIFQPTTGSAANGMRYDVQRKMTDSSGNIIYVRTAILRLKSSTTTQYPVYLESNTLYRLSVNTAYGSNGQSYTIDINENKSSLGNSIAKSTLTTNGTSIKTNTFYNQEMTFKTSKSGLYYICFGTTGSSTLNGFITDMIVTPLKSTVTIKFEDKNGKELMPSKNITNLTAGQYFECDNSFIENIEVDNNIYYFDINNSSYFIESLQEGDNELRLIFSDYPVVAESSVKIYFKDDLGNDLNEPVEISGLIPQSSFVVSEEYREALTMGENIYLLNEKDSELSLENLKVGRSNNLTLKFTMTTLNIKSSLLFFNNKSLPQTLEPKFSPVSDNNVYWESDDENVAIVKDGIVKPINKGIAVITAYSTKSRKLYSKCTVFVKSTTNLIDGWDGDNCIGQGSELNNFGWSCTLDSNPESGTTGLIFDTTSGSAANGHRYDPYRKMKDDLENVFYGRCAIIRLKNTTTMNLPVELESGKSYRLSGKIMFNSSNAKNTIGIYSNQSKKGTKLNSLTISTETGNINKLLPLNISFTAQNTGTHYLAFSTQNTGTITCFLVDLFVEEISSEVIIQYVDEEWNNIKDPYIIKGLSPGRSYDVDEELKLNFENNGYKYEYNENSFTRIDRLIEGTNYIILQYNKKILSSINDYKFNMPIKEVRYYDLKGSLIRSNMLNSITDVIYLKQVTYENNEIITYKMINKR